MGNARIVESRATFQTEFLVFIVKIAHKEMLFAGVAGLAALLALFTLPHLVAAPKLLFGRSLSAIEPSFFPYITLTLVAILSAVLISFSWVGSRKMTQQAVLDNNDSVVHENRTGFLRTVIFFVLLTSYGLMLKPVGFLISSFLVICATSIMLGNRNWLQILLLAVFAPICLYLLATRAMLVSLPELNQIELWYAQAVNIAMGLVKP